MSFADIQDVQAIEKQCFTTPWNISSFKHELGNKDTILKIAVFNEKIVGYICLRTLLDVTYILNLTVIPDFRRMGIASMLFRDALQELRKSKPDIKGITLEVRESNSAAINLYGKLGFKVTGRRNDYYQKPQENAVIMEMNISENVL
ncbi:MAG: ribosomal protein S18-alanine N-acetyltransferase [Thermodesulfovibrionia bacterium]|nr:ribosomal protein S18-alanine N-acetyltransferase [Thermodesulfovibrionia bacterium]